jgi:hypothetical protein
MEISVIQDVEAKIRATGGVGFQYFAQILLLEGLERRYESLEPFPLPGDVNEGLEALLEKHVGHHLVLEQTRREVLVVEFLWRERRRVNSVWKTRSSAMATCS